MTCEAVKIDIISGFLGAGKTTFANKLLARYLASGFRPVYIVNEFGKAGLDAEIAKADGFTAVEMTNGCVCCTLKDDATRAIAAVIEAYRPTHIVFEPSGVFVFDNFLEILKTPGLSGKCVLGGIVTIVDGLRFQSTKAAYGSFIYNQIKNSPVLLVSKLEKKPENTEELLCDLRAINPAALLIAKPWEELTAQDFEALAGVNPPQADAHEHRHGHTFPQTVTVVPQAEFTRERAERFLELCAGGRFGQIVRAKGIVKIDGAFFILNVTAGDAALSPFGGFHEPSLTFIGENLRKKEITEFIACHT
jgi:G3E family GTPase